MYSVPFFFLIIIRDISKEVTANMKIFVDDAKIKDSIKSEEDVEKLQVVPVGSNK